MDQQVEDEEFEQLLGEIPRATSAPPHLEELQRAYGSQMDQDSPFIVVREEDTVPVAVKPFTDIRYDELYEDFYREYSGQKKLPPPMENRMLYGDILSPKSAVNHSVLSSFYSQSLGSPRGALQQRQRELQHMHQKQEQEQQEQHDQQQKRLQLQRLQQQQQQQQQSSDSPLHRRRASVGSFPLDELSSAFGHLDFGEESLHSKNTHAMAASSNKMNRSQGVDVSNDLRMGRSASLDAIAGAALSAAATGAAGAGYENGNGAHTHNRGTLGSGNGSMGSRLDTRMDGYGGGGGQSSNSTLDALSNERALMAAGLEGFSGRQGETYQRQSNPGIDTYHRRSLSSPSPGIDHHFGSMSSGNAAGGLGGSGNIGDGRALRAEGVGNRDVERRVDSGATALESRTNTAPNSASYEQLLHHQRSSSSGSPPGLDIYANSTGMGMRNAPMDGYAAIAPATVDVYSMAAAVQATAARMFPQGPPPGLDMYSAAAAQVAAALAAQHHQLQQPQQQQGLASQRGLSMPASEYDVTSILQQQVRANQVAAMQAQIRQQQLADDDRARQHQLQQHMLLQQHQLQDRTFTSPPPGQYLHGNHSPTRVALNPLRHGSPPSHLSSSYPPHSPPPFHKRGPHSGSGYDSPTWGGQHTQPHSPTGPAHGSTCRYFAQGYCSRGDACPFTHSPSQAERLMRAQERTSNLSHKELRATPPLARDDRADRSSAYSDKQLPRRSPRGGAGVSGTTEIGRSRGEASVFSGRRGKVEAGVLTNGYSNGHQNREEIQGHAGHGHHTGQRGEHGPERSRSGRTNELLDFDFDGSALSGRHGHGSPPSHSQHTERAGGGQQKGGGHSDGTPSPPPSGQAPKYSTLEEVEGRIYTIAKDQHGCRFLQRKFDEGGPEEVAKIFGEIVEHIIELMTDPFGNYLVQKLLEVCNEGQRKDILDRVTRQSELISISLNMHGTRAVQKLIETLTSPEQVQMVIQALSPGVVTLIKDLNGNHVVQRCLQRLSNDDSQFIFDAAATHCVEIATHRHGCCVLQRCVDYASGAQRQRLVAEIAANAYVLSQDPFGNYVVQYILDLQMPWASAEVMVRLEGNYPQLAMQKFSSNVVEKCLKLAQEENRNRIVRELIATPRLGQLLQDPYANYVVQSALSVSKGALHNGLVDAIKPHLPALRSSPYGKRILSRTNLKKG